MYKFTPQFGVERVANYDWLIFGPTRKKLNEKRKQKTHLALRLWGYNDEINISKRLYYHFLFYSNNHPSQFNNEKKKERKKWWRVRALNFQELFFPQSTGKKREKIRNMKKKPSVYFIFFVFKNIKNQNYKYIYIESLFLILTIYIYTLFTILIII